VPQPAATIANFGQALEMVKAMQDHGMGDDYRPLAGRTLAEIIEGHMDEALDCWLERLGVVRPEGRSGRYRRHLLTELSDIELAVPRTRRYCPSEVVRAYPKAVACLRDDLDELFTCFRYTTFKERRAVRTTNAIERRFHKSAPHPNHRRLLGSNLDGPHPLCSLHA
jgi:transposase-like protein